MGKIRAIRAWTGKKFVFSQTLPANEFMTDGKIVVQHLLEFQENRFVLGGFSLDLNSQNLFGIFEGEYRSEPYDHFVLSRISYLNLKQLAKDNKAYIAFTKALDS